MALLGVHDRRPRRHLDPLDRGREEGQLRQARESARGGAREPRRDRQRGEAELARDVGAGQHALAGDVVGPGRAGGDDALQEGLADVVLADELQRSDGTSTGSGTGELWTSSPRRRPSWRGRSGTRLLGADRVRPEDDRRAQQVQIELRMGLRLSVQEALDLGLLLGVEEMRRRTRGPFLGDALGVVAVEAVGGDRRGVDETLRAGRGCGPERVERPFDVDRADRLARRVLPVIMNARCTTTSASRKASSSASGWP